MIRTFTYITLMILVGVGPVAAGLVVNEILANEPGGMTSLEWLELYNDSPLSANLDFYGLRIYSGPDSTEYALFGAGTIEPRGYFVICRDTLRFEQHWGDSSGVWGNDSTESYPIFEMNTLLELSPNDSGRVALFRWPSLHSEFEWHTSGVDGHSWERVHPITDEIGQSVDPTGSTPGRINSLTPLPIDLALANVEVASINDSARLIFEIVNRGLSAVSTAFLDMGHFDESAPDSLGVLVASEPVGLIDSGITVLLVGQWQFTGHYQKLIARLRVSNDDRSDNNLFVFVAPGADYPPVILSEVQVRAINPLGSEWVEVENVSDSTIDLSGWLLGDSIKYVSISSAELLLSGGEYLVIAEDTAAFRFDYSVYSGLLHEPVAWREFNNGSDSVRLLDRFGLQADRFYYNDNPVDGHTWSRSSTGDHAGEWGRSEDAGGTPGAANRVRFDPEGTRTVGITITPRIIAPDGDGRDDSTVIIVSASDASSYILRLYDRNGRLVRTFEDYAPDLAERYVWRGRDNGGRRLPIGIYVLYFEAVGVESIKKTIVLAR